MTTLNREDFHFDLDSGLEMIVWRDHYTRHGWGDEDARRASRPDYRCVSVGWLLAEDERAVQLAPNRANNHDCADVQVILKADIEKRWKLEPRT